MLTNLMRRFVLSFALALGIFTNLNAATWIGDVADDVTNNNIDITGDVTFTADVMVTVDDGGSRTVTLNGDYFLTHADSSVLTLNVVDGTLVFDLTGNDLTFKGADTPFEVFIKGSGRVEFKLAGGRTVSFKEGSAGTKVYVEMADPGPTVEFTRTAPSDENAFVQIGKNSLITYVSTSQPGSGGDTDTATILFDPTNFDDETGRLVLNIADTGGMIIASHWLDGATVNLNTPGAGSPKFLVENLVASINNSGLMVVNNNKTFFDLSIDPWCTGVYGGNRYGFVLGNNAQLKIDDGTYLDYVGSSTNKCPNPVITCADASPASCYIKERNPSAFFVDGDLGSNAVPAQIELGECAALVFRSGINNVGVIENPLDATYSSATFTVAPENKTAGAGNIVFDVEGLLSVVGSGTASSKIEILSVAVDPTGGRLLSSELGSCENAIFPLRDFTQDASYNSGCFLINNSMALHHVSLVHTDGNHAVYEKNDVNSEPTYIGGETFSLKANVEKPKIVFDNANLLVQTDIAFTGLDLVVTNSTCEQDNISRFIFFQNGYKLDDGTGRQMVLGSYIGAGDCDGCGIISKDAQLDVMQSFTCEEPCGHDLKLRLENWYNDETIVQGIAGACTSPELVDQLAVHTIYLGHASNISIGKQAVGDDDPITGCPIATLNIAGNFFSFETRGGMIVSPENSNITGQGGIFVDNLGYLTIEPTARANIATMVTKSGSGNIHLPKNQVFFRNRVGIADWWKDQALVAQDQCLSDYTINWIALKKQYCDFLPYVPSSYNSCPATCPAVSSANIEAIPMVQGSVEQLQVKASRIGDPVHLKIDGGYVRELVFLTGCHSAEAPAAVVALENHGRIGLGTANVNPDSTQTSGLLGVNGITLIANGNGRVDLNSDLVINNFCHILKGPEFSVTSSHVLTFFSEVPRRIVVKEGAVLDLSSFGFDALHHSVQFAGDITLVFEPGSHLVLGTAADSMVGVAMLDECRVLIMPDKRSKYSCAETFCRAHKGGKKVRSCDGDASVADTDAFRVKFAGVGEVLLADQSRMDIPKYSYLGVENWASADLLFTDINFHLMGAGSVYIGEEHKYEGGTLQVGNTVDLSLTGTVSWKVQLDGADTKFAIGAQGLLAFALGVVDKSSSLPNEWCLASLYNVAHISIDITNGTFQHNMIYSGNEPYASLIAIGDYYPIEFPKYDFYLSGKTASTPGRSLYASLTAGTLLGGGNMAFSEGIDETPRNLPVLGDDGAEGASIMRSHTYFVDGADYQDVSGLDLMQHLRVIQVNPYACPAIIKNVIGPSLLRNYVRAGLGMVGPELMDNPQWLVRQEVNFIQATNKNDQFSSEIDALTAAKYVHGGSKPVVNESAGQPENVIVRLFSYQ